MATTSQSQIVILRASRSTKSVAGRVLVERRNEENLWSNPPEATLAMKRAIEQLKGRFNKNEPWDGDFDL